jgi:putative mRNA 3-end processing factor
MIRLTSAGLFCEAGGFHIDPSRKVDVAVITHAHSDHARRGSRQYLCAESSVGLLKRRLGADAPVRGIPYRETFEINGVRLSFHPAGHILGSAQVRVEHDSRVWVVSGDYKREADPTREPFEVVPCDVFITESTFGHPSYEWNDPARVIDEIHAWWRDNAAAGLNSVLFCYALGKAQRVLAGLLSHTQDRVLVFGETAELTDCYRGEGVAMVPTVALESLSAREASRLRGELVVAPHALASSPWMERLGDPQTAFASGWMRAGASWTRGRYDRGFVLSDHADWPGLVRTARETGARHVLVLGGRDDRLHTHLRREGLPASLLTRPERGAPEPVQGELFKP